jgi:SAM-dependent methyltransferase
MHDSAFRIGELVMQTYCDLPKARILEIGSMDVNGSLRDFAEPSTQYVGVDLEKGPAVDVVVKPGERLPFDDASFDLIMASSAFEHDPRFWETFLEMCRVAQPGGHIYVNAPSNGGVHRYPLDCWRFYPDAGLALMDYAKTSKIPIDLVESFVGKRYQDSWDGWNDFVAIFRKGPSKVPMNLDFVYKKYPSYNAKTWSSPDLDYETSVTEDMQLGRDLRQQIAEQAGKVEELEKERSEAEKLSEKLTADLRISESEASQLRSAVGSLERQVENLSGALKAQTDTLSAALSDARDQFRHFEKERVKAEKIRDKLTADLRISESEASQLRSAVGSLEQQVENLSGALKAQTDAFARIQKRDLDLIGTLEADMSKLRDEHLSHVDHTSAELARLRASEAELDSMAKSGIVQQERNRMAMEWLRAFHIAMAGRPSWWFLLPKQSRRAREYEMLRSVGLFDDRSYLARHADVAAERADPLDHYITYGLNEDRDRGFG